MMKNVKNVREWYPLCHVSAYHNDVKMPCFHFKIFQRTECGVNVILLMLVGNKHPEQFSLSFI